MFVVVVVAVAPAIVVVVVVQSEDCVFRSRRGHQYGGGIDAADTSPTSLIVILWIYTALNTKEFAR
jgi:hypothetical protein